MITLISIKRIIVLSSFSSLSPQLFLTMEKNFRNMSNTRTPHIQGFVCFHCATPILQYEAASFMFNLKTMMFAKMTHFLLFYIIFE